MSNEATDDGGPAFPIGPADVDGFRNGVPGISMRDYFAAKAMEGEIARPDGFETPANVAAYAYEVADAMLKARKP